MSSHLVVLIAHKICYDRNIFKRYGQRVVSCERRTTGPPGSSTTKTCRPVYFLGWGSRGSICTIVTRGTPSEETQEAALAVDRHPVGQRPRAFFTSPAAISPTQVAHISDIRREGPAAVITFTVCSIGDRRLALRRIDRGADVLKAIARSLYRDAIRVIDPGCSGRRVDKTVVGHHQAVVVRIAEPLLAIIDNLVVLAG